jgi:hypothetical protein
VVDFKDDGTAELNDASVRGMRYDQPADTWCPTETSLAQRRAAHDRASAGSDLPVDRARDRYGPGMYGQKTAPFRVRAYFMERMRLPTKIVCVQCGTRNLVVADLHNG